MKNCIFFDSIPHLVHFQIEQLIKSHRVFFCGKTCGAAGGTAAAFGIRHFGAQRSGSSVAVSSCAFRDKKNLLRAAV